MKTIIKTPLLGKMISVLALMLALQLPVFASNGTVESRTVALPGDHRDDGMWSALYAAKNGMVYIGAQSHGGYANLYQYNPETGVMRHITNIMEEAGEYGKGIYGQAKIHTRFVEDKEGIIYFGTGNQGSGPRNVDPRSWEGAYWWSYDPEADRVEKLGHVGHGSTDLYALAYDQVRHRLYGTGWNGHLYIFDIESRTTTDAGRASNWDVCRTIVTDEEGNCYGTSDKHQMFKYDAEAERLLDIPVIVPHDPYQWPQLSSRLHLDRKNIWRVAQWSEKDKGIYIIDGGSSYLSRYDPKDGAHGSIEFLAQMAAEPLRGNNNLPYATLSLTIGKDNKSYFAPVASSFDYGDETDNSTNQRLGFLVSYDPETGERIDHGTMVEEGTGNRVFGTQGATTGPDGTLYFFGAVEEPDTDKAIGRMRGGVGFVIKLIIIDPAQL